MGAGPRPPHPVYLPGLLGAVSTQLLPICLAGSVMPSPLTALLCLGLCLSHRVGTQKRSLSKPTIWAKPNFMIPSGTPAIIWCQGAHLAIEYQLYFEKQCLDQKRPNLPGLMNIVNFSIQAMTLQTLFIRVKCRYRIWEHWSESSDPLELVVTGMYDTPTLRIHPASKVIPGANVTFYCDLETATKTFFLLKEGTSSRPQRRSGTVPAAFPVGPVTAAHRGTYRCFGSYSNHVWSFPSEPVTLLVIGGAGVTNLAPTGQPSTSDSWKPHVFTTKRGSHKGLTVWDYTSENLFRMGLAFLVLVALVCLLAEDRLSRKKTEERVHQASRQERRMRFRIQRALNE